MLLARASPCANFETLLAALILVRHRRISELSLYTILHAERNLKLCGMANNCIRAYHLKQWSKSSASFQKGPRELYSLSLMSVPCVSYSTLCVGQHIKKY